MANGTQTVSAVITADAKPFKRSVQDAGKSFDAFSKAAVGFGIVAAAAFAGATAAAGKFLADSVKAAAESEAIARGLQNAAENAGVFAEQAGGIAGVTKELQTFAKTLGETIGLDDEKILGIVSQWLAVPQLAQLGVGGLKNLVKVAADVAAGTNKDLDTIATAFVKVAGDGETALSKLLRAGIVFTDEQKAVYQSLLDSNDELGAQQYLIDELSKKYEGAAESIANPFDRIKEIFKNFQEDIGQKFLPQIEAAVPAFENFLNQLEDDPAFNRFIEDLVKNFRLLLPKLQDLLPVFFELIEKVLPLLIELLPLVTTAVGNFAEILGYSNDETKKQKTSLEGLVDFLQVVLDTVKNVIFWFAEQRKEMENGRISIFAFTGIIGGLQTAFYGLRDALEAVSIWWNELWGIQQSRPLSQVGSADYLDRVLTPSPTYSDDRRVSNYNINVNAVAPSADVGRAVVASIDSYRRAGGIY